jgi:hypothetical protein
MKTQPFTKQPKDLTPALVEQARAFAKSRGFTQFGFNLTKGAPCYITILVDGGTLKNPTGSIGDAS